jgi:hypothetical protein
MWGWLLNALKGAIPFLPSILDRFLPSDSAKAAELRAQKELIEAKAFAEGRIPPKYIMGYVIAFMCVAFSIIILAVTFVPSFVADVDSLLRHIKDLIGLSNDAFGGGQ